MIKKIISYLIILFVILLIIGIAINYYVLQPKEFPSEMCWKGKYLIQIEDEGSVYTRMKQFYCEQEGDIIILEESK